MNDLRINKSYAEMFPDNCPLIEKDGDGNEVGTCTYHLKNGYCPRHGLVVIPKPSGEAVLCDAGNPGA